MNDSHTTITILIENRAVRGDLIAEHGFAAWIEAGGRRILFDSGQSGAVADNAVKLGADLSTADFIVLSHGHYDHTGGLPAALELAASAAIAMQPSAAVTPRWSVRPAGARMIGMPEDAVEALEEKGRRVMLVTAPALLAPGVYLTGPIPRETAFEDVGGPFFLDPEGVEPDLIEDDMALWIETPRGKAVVCGCAHAGVVNTLNFIQRVAPGSPIHAVLGGFHLVNAGEERLKSTEAALAEIAPAVLAPGHCTGADAIERLQSRFPTTFTPCRGGDCFEF